MGTDFSKDPGKARPRRDDDEPHRRPRDDEDDDRGGYDIRRRGAPLADRGSRFVAALIDGILMMICQIPGQIMIFSAISTSDPMAILANPTAVWQVAFAGFLVGELGLLAYQGAMAYMISQSGQTIGKKVMSIRIVLYESGRLPGVVNGWVLRWLPIHALSFIPFVGGLIGLVDVLFIFGAEKRCIHDLIAGTKVVVAEPLREEARDRDDD